MASVLILAPRFDLATRISADWAEALASTLKGVGHEPVLMTGPEATYSALSKVGSVDFVMYLGHGEPHRLIGQPVRQLLGSGPTLIDSPTVHLLMGRPTYAVACFALLGLGSAYGTAFPHGTFVGYSGDFGIHVPNQALFYPVVETGALGLVDGRPGTDVAESIRVGWHALVDDFLIGKHAQAPDAFIGAFIASTNGRVVGSRP